jgi:HD-GYP domain-containing protein (c-di-GMP phosphodiesterase class II)
MPYLKLKADIVTYDKKTLFHAGTEITEAALKDIVSLNNTKHFKSHSLMHHESIKKDLIGCISQPPYQWIFSLGDEYSALLKFMEKVQLIQPVLETVDFLKHYDIYTYHHTLTVFTLSTLVASYMIDNYQDHISEVMSSPTHDVGKICVPIGILQKSTPLTRNELDILEQHPVSGYVLLSHYMKDADNITAVVARDHHEKKNGTGYPYGTHLDNPISEIVVVCDIYDALISQRPYRPVPYDNRTALEELTELATRNEINVEAVKILIALNRKDKPDYRKIVLSQEKRGSPPQLNNYRKIAEDDSST